MAKRVLLVDDEVEIIDFLENFLKRFKLTSIKATSGEDALALYDKEQVDFVFLDIQLKAMDGISVLKELKRINPEVKVIMITGKSEDDFQEKAKSFGALDYITKPLDLSELKDKVYKYILD